MILSRPRQRWWLLAGVLGAGLVGAAASISPYAGAGLLALGCAVVLLLNPVVVLPLMIVGSALNRFGLQSGDANLRLDLLVAALLALVVANRIAVRTVPLRALRSSLFFPLLVYLGANLFSTALFAVERTRGLKLDAEIAGVVITYVLVIILVATQHDLRLAMRALWAVTVGEATFGLLSLVMFVAHLGLYGVQIGDLGVPMVYGTQWEANIFGSFLLGNFFLLLGDYLTHERSHARTLGLILTVSGIAASMTRTVWLALILGVLVFLALAIRVRLPGAKLLPVLVAVPVLALLGLIIGSATPFAGRLTDIVNLQTSSAAGRITLYQAGFDEWKHHPILGLGTGSFNVGAVPGGAHPWLPSLFLMTLHDTGVIGMFALVWVIVAFYRATFRGIRGNTSLSFIAIGAIASFTGLLLAFQTTTGFWFAYPWIVAALGVSAARFNCLTS